MILLTPFETVMLAAYVAFSWFVFRKRRERDD